MPRWGDSRELLLSDLDAQRHQGRPIALICCTFRQFDLCEALHGPARAEALIEAGQRCLLDHSPEGTSLVRMGPAELALVVPLNTMNAGELAALAERLSRQCTVDPGNADGDNPLLLTAAIGAAQRDQGHSVSAATLLTQARLAMHQACHRKGNQWVLATPQLQHQAKVSYREQAELMLALQQQRFTAHLQPIIDLKQQRPLGFEGLARWVSGDGRVLKPKHFLRLSQIAGLTAILDLQVIATCLRAAPQLIRAWPGKQPLLLSMNISAQLIESDCNRRDLLALLDAQRPPDGIQLQLELVEDAFSDDRDCIDDLLQQLAQRDVLIAIDDFGTGYSSLSRLHDLAIQAIKLDRSFVQRIDSAHRSSNQLLDSLVGIGRNLGITLTAEGVETEHQRLWLLEHGIAQAQGYLFSEPLSIDDAIATLMATNGARAAWAGGPF